MSGVYYYFIAAQDIHNNKSPVAFAQSPNITINMTLFIEGFYNNVSDQQVSDTISAYLRNANSPYAIVDLSKTILNANGSASLSFGNAPPGTYYIVMKHRNALETWSKSGGEILAIGSPANYNFSTPASQVFGNNMIQVDTSPVRFAIYSGDVNQDGFIDLTDINLIFNNAGNFVTGYVVTDLNGDNVIDLTDLTLAFNNSSNFLSKIIP